MADNFDYQRKIFEKIKEYGDISEQVPVKLIREFIGKLPNKLRILDLGCGEGGLLSLFVGNHEIYGIDGAENLLRKAKKKGLRVTLGNLEKPLPYRSGFFDVLVMHHVLEHIVDTDRFLVECNRVLKKKGGFIIAAPNVANPLSYALLLFDYPPSMGARYRSAHVRDFTVKTLRIAIENNGFKIEKILGGAIFFPPYQRFTLLVRFFPKVARDVVVFSRKIKVVKYKGVRFDFVGKNLKD